MRGSRDDLRLDLPALRDRVGSERDELHLQAAVGVNGELHAALHLH